MRRLNMHFTLPAIVALMIPALGGCIFETRQAALPDSGSTWVVPDDPNRVFLNMKSGLTDLKGANYTRSLAGDFTFVPLASDVSVLPPATFDNWTVDVENDVLNKILSEASAITVDFKQITQFFNQTPVAKFYSDYELTIITNSLPPDTTTYKGKGQFDMREGSKGWQLFRWEDLERVDNPPPGFATWGFLRGDTRRQL